MKENQILNTESDVYFAILSSCKKLYLIDDIRCDGDS